MSQEEFSRSMRAMKHQSDSFTQFKRALMKEPIKFIRWLQAEYIESEDGYHNTLSLQLTAGYEFALKVYGDKALRKEFFAEAFFKDERRKMRRRATLRLVMKFMTKARKGPRCKRGNIYAKALEKVFHDHVPAEKVAELLREKGIEAIYKEGLRLRKTEAGQASKKVKVEKAIPKEEPSKAEAPWRKEGELADNDERIAAKVVKEPAIKADPGSPGKVQLPDFNSGFYLHVEVTEELFYRAIHLRLEGMLVNLHTPERHVDGKFRRLVGTEAPSKAKRRTPREQ